MGARSAWVATLVGLVLPGLVIMTESPATAVRSDAARSSTVPAPVRVPTFAATAEPDALRLLSVEVDMLEGERRVVVADIAAYQPKDTPDASLMATMALACWPSSAEVASSSATQNLVRGRTTALRARFVYVAPVSGTVTCVVNAYGSRPRPTSGGTQRNRWYADSGSRITVGAPQPSWAASTESTARSSLVHRRRAVRGLPTFVQSLGSSHTATLHSDHKLTTCSSAGGSRDETTFGRDLCARYVDPRGSLVRLVVRAVQLGRDGPCGSRVVIDQTRKITPTVHHLMVNAVGTLRASSKPGCLREFRISTVLRNRGGAAFVVHQPSEVTTVALG